MLLLNVRFLDLCTWFPLPRIKSFSYFLSLFCTSRALTTATLWQNQPLRALDPPSNLWPKLLAVSFDKLDKSVGRGTDKWNDLPVVSQYGRSKVGNQIWASNLQCIAPYFSFSVALRFLFHSPFLFQRSITTPWGAVYDFSLFQKNGVIG